MCPSSQDPNWEPPLLPWPGVVQQLFSGLAEDHADEPLVLDTGAPMVPPPNGILGLCPIESVRFEGRMLLRPWVSYSMGEESVHLYCNCEAISETWVNVTITAEQLGEMLAAVLVARGNVEPAALDVLRSLCQRL